MLGLIIKKHSRLAALILMLMLPSAVFAQNPTIREYPVLYKSPRAMGMGGAYTAIGGRVDSLFYNPATLINIPKDKGWEVNVLNLSVEAGKNTRNFIDDMQDANDTPDLNHDGKTDDDQEKALNEVLAQYRGKNLHLGAADFTSFGKSYDSFAFGIGALANLQLNAMSHQGFGPEGFLEVNAAATYGAIGGFSMGVSDGLYAGLSLKSLTRESVNHNFTAREFVEHQDNLDDYISDELRKRGTAVGFDAGMLWKFERDSWWRPSVGLSMLNIGDLNFKEAGKVPMTVNAGFAVNPNISWSRSLLIGIDYVDLLNGYSQDKDMAKRIRLGTELQLFDIMPVEMSLRLGLYEGYPTFGADLRLLTFLLSYTMYSEEVGAYSGQSKDTRQMLTLNFGW